MDLALKKILDSRIRSEFGTGPAISKNGSPCGGNKKN